MSSSSASSNLPGRIQICDLILLSRGEFIKRYLAEDLADSAQLRLDLIRGKRSEFKTVKGSSLEQTKALEEQFRQSTELRRKYDTKAFDIYFALKGKFDIDTWHILAQKSELEEIEAKGDVFGLFDLLEKVGAEQSSDNPLFYAIRLQHIYTKMQKEDVSIGEHIDEWNKALALLARLDPIQTRSADSRVGKTVLKATERLDCLNFIRSLHIEKNRPFLAQYFGDCKKMSFEYVTREYYYWKPLIEKVTQLSGGHSQVKQEPDPQASLGAAAQGNRDRSRSRSRSRSPESGHQNKKQKKSEPECRHCTQRGLPPWRRRHPSSQCKFA